MKNITFMALSTFFLSTTQLSALPFDGSKDIKLVTKDGEKIVVGKIEFAPQEETTTYDITWADTAFEEHFLSMRPFRCLEGSAKHWCRVPYPYTNKRTIRQGDLTDLEYDLLFIWKGSGEYGINMWNGVYYDLKVENNKLVGSLNEMDMNILAVPPDEGNFRPVGEYDLEPGDADSHWLPILVIE